MPLLAALAAALVGISIVLIFFVAPEDADQGFSQKIFYFHVPIALTAYAPSPGARSRRCCCSGAATSATTSRATSPSTRERSSGRSRSRTAPSGRRHRGGYWWLWSEDQLVLFLVLFLFYSPTSCSGSRSSEGPRRANISAVYALFGVVLIPVSFLAIRLAENVIHPTVFTREGPQMTGTMFFTFCVAWLAMTVLAYALYRLELLGKRLDSNLRELREILTS